LVRTLSAPARVDKLLFKRAPPNYPNGGRERFQSEPALCDVHAAKPRRAARRERIRLAKDVIARSSRGRRWPHRPPLWQSLTTCRPLHNPERHLVQPNRGLRVLLPPTRCPCLQSLSTTSPPRQSSPCPRSWRTALLVGTVHWHHRVPRCGAFPLQYRAAPISWGLEQH